MRETIARLGIRAAALVAVASAQAVFLQAQTRQEPASTRGQKWTPPRTADGRPDLQGTWDFATLTPLQRPANLKGTEFLTDEQAADVARQAEARRAAIDSAPLPAGQVGGYNQFWYEPGKSVIGDKRTSLIIDPPDGRIPPMTPEGQKRADAHRAQLDRPAEGPEERPAPERCLLGYNSGPPMAPGGYNQNFQLVQTRDHVVIHNEMVHDARIVPLDGRPHLAAGLRPWLADSRGRWEGDTLVVHTTNYSDRTWNQFSGWNWASDENLRLTERFTLIGPDTLLYEFTVDDPSVWTNPWTAAVPMARTTELLYEYACHEGNYGMQGILRSARADERGADAKSRTR
jgi:hypothetical protein